jgi:hypothetical protein
MGLGEVLLKLNVKPTPLRDQGGAQAQSTPAVGDFVSRYLKCLGINDLSKVPDVLKGVDIKEDTIKCIDNLVRSESWDELFMKLNMEIALFEAVSRKEIRGLVSQGGSAGGRSLALPAMYSFILSIAMIRELMNNKDTTPVALTTLAKATYALFDLYLELTKRKVIPPNLETEVWKVRDTLGDLMRELFKGDRMIAVHGKSFDRDRQLR